MSMLALPAFADAGPSNGHEPQVSKFPHTRAQLSAFTRQYKPLDNYDSDAEQDEFSRVPSSLLYRVVELLENEQEEDLKGLLKESYGMDNESVENGVLDLMHKHRDDIAGVPFMFLTPTRRPISRPSSRASTHSTRLYPARPDTPQSAPSSPLALIFKRPHTPLTSPLAGTGVNQPGGSYMTAKSDYSASPGSSPVLSFAPTTQFTASLPASPLSSPRLLHAKAHIQRPLSAASNPNPGLRTDTPSPDLWSHAPFRASSNLAIAAPLIPEQTQFGGLDNQELEEEDQFDPFSHHDVPPAFHSIVSDFDAQWVNSPEHGNSDAQANQYLNPYAAVYEPSALSNLNQTNLDDHSELDPDAAAVLTDGMTPFDVLSSVFGSTLAPSELEEALAGNGYDFERAMIYLVDRAVPASQIRGQGMGGTPPLIAGQMRGGRGGYMSSRTPPRYVNGRPVPGGNRVCRYFVAGECLRADCRFSHDLERALCRFWLRGACAKNETCEFLHHLPKDIDISSLNFNLNRMNLGPLANQVQNQMPPDDFPALGGYEANGKNKRGYQDTSRGRFAAAVKKAPVHNEHNLLARREAMGNSADNLYHRSAIIAPRASPRLKLRPPALLPTLAMGDAVNQIYMTYRSRALQLGAARNACLSRAADAWRRGDGAAAKRFSREGQELNSKMSTEMTAAAAKLVKERAKHAEQAVRARDLSWSDDPADRSIRGKSCGSGLGVYLGVASKDVGGPNLTADERTEALLDLHSLHANEATDVLEEFLLGLEEEHFYGLAYVVVGEEKHVGTQDVSRGASRNRLATGVREWVHRWGYPWQERDGIICIDPLTHLSE